MPPRVRIALEPLPSPISTDGLFDGVRIGLQGLGPFVSGLAAGEVQGCGARSQRVSSVEKVVCVRGSFWPDGPDPQDTAVDPIKISGDAELGIVQYLQLHGLR